jgi:myosin heavy subunit
MAQEIIGFKVEANADGAVKSVGSLKQQLREAQKDVTELSAKFGVTSQEAVNAAKKAAELKDAIGDAKALTDAFNPDAKFKAFTSSLSAVAGGFGAVQGAMGLLGTESDQVQQTLLKVQSAMAISQGLQSIGEGIDSFKQLGAVIQNTTIFQKANNAVTVIATKIQQAFGVATVGVGRSFTLLKTAIAATGIGLLVVGVGALISKISSWTSSTDSAKAANDRLNATIDEQNKLFDKNRQALQNAREDAILEAKIKGESAENIFKINQEYSQKDIELAQKNVADKKKILDDFNAEQLRIEQEIREGSGPLAEKFIRRGREKNKEQLDKLTKDYEDAVRISDQSVRQLNVEGANERLRIADKERADAKEAQSKATQEAKVRSEKERHEELKRIERQNEAKMGLMKNLNDAQAKEEEEQRKKREEQFAINSKKELERTVSSAQQVQDALSQINAANSQKARDQYVAQLNAEGELANESYAQQLERYRLTRELQRQALVERKASATEFATFDAETKKGEIDRERIASSTKLGIVSGALSTIADAVGQNTIAGKALSIAQATIDTYAGANKALKTYPAPWGAIAASTVIAAGLLNVRKIISTKLPKPPGSNVSDSTSASISGAAPIAPAPTPQVQSTLLNAQAIQTLGNATSRAYVVESDVSSSQERIRRINRAARLG